MRAVPSAIGSVYFEVSSRRHETGDPRARCGAATSRWRCLSQAGEEQPRRISPCSGRIASPFCSVGDQRIVVRLGDRNAARERGGASCPSARNQVAFGARSDLAEERGERDAGPLARAGEAGELLRRDVAGRSRGPAENFRSTRGSETRPDGGKAF